MYKKLYVRVWYGPQGLELKVVRGDDDLDEHLLADGDELLDPFAYVQRSLASVVLLLKDREVVISVVRAAFEDLRQCGTVDGHLFVCLTEIVLHISNEVAALQEIELDDELLIVRGDEGDDGWSA